MPGPIDSAGNTTPDYGAQASQLQSGLAATINQPSAPPPQYQAPADPVTQTFFGKLLTGALQGLAGGVRSGMINEAGRGTPGFKPDASGADYAHMLQQQQNNQDLANQKQAQEQAQQQFTNASETYRNQQAAIAQKAQAYQSQLNALHTAQAMQYATADQQRAYFKGEQDKEDHLNQNGVQSLGNFSDGNGQTATDKLAAWMKQNNKQISDFTQVHSQDAQGHDIIKVFDNPDHEVDADQVNKELAAVGSPRRVSGSMTYADKHALVTSEGAKAAEQIYTQRKEDYQAKLKMREQAQEQSLIGAREMSLQKEKERATGTGDDITQPLPDNALEGNVDSLHKGIITSSQLAPGMGKEAGAKRTAAIARYNYKYMNPASPDYDKNAVPIETLDKQDKYIKSDKYFQATNGMAELFGSTGTKLPDGTEIPPNRGAMEDMHDALIRLNKKYPAGTKIDADVARKAEQGLGDPDVVAATAAANELALRYQKFASGGGIGSQSEWEAVRDAIIDAQPMAAINAKFAHLNDLGAQAATGIRLQGGMYAAHALQGVRVPEANQIDANQRSRGQDNQGNPLGANDRKVGDVVQTKNGPRTIKSITTDPKTGKKTYQ